MSSKIDGYTVPPISNTPVGRVPAATKCGDPSGGAVRAVPALDSVALTSDAQSLQRLEQAISASPVADSERVDKIRAQLRDGAYLINPQAIADQLARMEWELSR